MSDTPETTNDVAEVTYLLEQCRYRLLIHAPGVEPNIKNPQLLFDTAIVDDPPGEEVLLEIKEAVDDGDTVYLSFADAKRREFVHGVVRRLGWTSVKMAFRPADTRH